MPVPETAPPAMLHPSRSTDWSTQLAPHVCWLGDEGTVFSAALGMALGSEPVFVFTQDRCSSDVSLLSGLVIRHSASGVGEPTSKPRAPNRRLASAPSLGFLLCRGLIEYPPQQALAYMPLMLWTLPLF